jgi:hypothetical protein
MRHPAAPNQIADLPLHQLPRVPVAIAGVSGSLPTVVAALVFAGRRATVSARCFALEAERCENFLNRFAHDIPFVK